MQASRHWRVRGLGNGWLSPLGGRLARERRDVVFAAAAVAAVAALIIVTAVRVTHGVVQRPVATRITALPASGGAVVPADFLGLSFDSSDLPALAAASHDGNLAAMLRSLGQGVMRIGGNGADDAVAWVQPGQVTPGWAKVTIDSATLEGLAALASETGWKVILTVNLAHFDPTAAASEAAAAQQQLAGHLEGIAIGNEPEYYTNHGFRPHGWGTSDYGYELQAYRKAILSKAPGATFVGPDTASANSSWGATYRQVLSPSLITNHYYAIDGCHGRLRSLSPRRLSLLSGPVLAAESRALGTFVSTARGLGLPARIDETNSVSCGGKADPSQTYQAALWGAIYISQAIQAGESGINFQINRTMSYCDGYSPICTVGKSSLQFQVKALWYAFLLTRSLIGSTPLSTTVAGNRFMVARAFRTPTGRVLLLVVNRGTHPSNITFQVRGTTLQAGSILRLVAPSLRAMSGATLGGGQVNGEGNWRPAANLPRARASEGRLFLAVPPRSAALVTTS